VLNNPLAYTDPSGYFSFGKIFKSIFKAVTNLVTNPLALAAVAVAVAVPFIAPGLIAAAGTAFGIGGFAVNSTANVVLSGFIGGALSGAIGSGGDIKATFISALTAAAFAGVGEFTGHRPAFLSIEHIQNIVGHAAVGCASQAAGGGSCQAGALSAAAGSFAGPVTANAGFAGGLVITAAVGGTASVIGGGKFANGAVTAGYGYLFNGAASQLLLNNVVGKIGEYLRVFQLELEGYNVTTQVLYQDPSTLSKSFVDITAYRDVPLSETTVWRRYLFEEIKTGGGQVKVNQQAVMDAIEKGTAIPLGPRATLAKLIPGVPLRDQLQNFTADPRPGSQ
jgi:hypothetical protein